MCLHGFTDTWRTWELVLPRLERHHDVLAPTLAGHAGGPPLEHPASHASLADAVEAAMDAAGFTTAHLVGLSCRADARTRTADPFITSEVLYQLSYVGNARHASGGRAPATLETRVDGRGRRSDSGGCRAGRLASLDLLDLAQQVLGLTQRGGVDQAAV